MELRVALVMLLLTCCNCSGSRPCSLGLRQVMRHGETTTSKCSTCICQNGSLNCNRTACSWPSCGEDQTGSTSILRQPVMYLGECCPQCRRETVCTNAKSGQAYRLGDVIQVSKADMECDTCTCLLNGSWQCLFSKCQSLSCLRQVTLDGRCCPVCQEDVKCKNGASGKSYIVGDLFTPVSGIPGCHVCKCLSNGTIECMKPVCPLLPCVDKVFVEDYCCPICMESLNKFRESLTDDQIRQLAGPFSPGNVKSEVDSHQSSCLDIDEGHVYAEGEEWNRQCVTYNCSMQGVVARNLQCPVLNCEKRFQMKTHNLCCPSCISEGQPVTECTSQEMTIFIPKELVPLDHPQELVLRDPSCRSTMNSTHFIIRARFGHCATKLSFDHDKIIYENEIKSFPVHDSLITRKGQVKIPVKCVFSLSRSRIFGGAFQPKPKDLPLKAEGNGTSLIELGVSDEQGAFTKADASRDSLLGDVVHMRVKGPPYVDLALERCWATPSENASDVMFYDLVRNGCSSDETVVIRSLNGKQAEDRGEMFSFQLFEFNDRRGIIFVHCNTVACASMDEDSFCRRDCIAEKRRKRFARRRPSLTGVAYSRTMVSCRLESKQ